MKLYNKYKLLLLLFSGIAFFSCEENDPLSEMGTVKEGKVPFVTLSGMQSLYAAGDSIEYNVFYWTIKDDIDKMALLKGELITVVGSLTVNDGAGDVTVTIDQEFETEIAQEGEEIEHDEFDYETARNAYNKLMIYEVPAQYQQVKIEDAEEESLAKVSDVIYSADIKSAILTELAANGVNVTWEGLADILQEINLTIESTLSFQFRVFNQQGLYKDSPIREVKIGALKE